MTKIFPIGKRVIVIIRDADPTPSGLVVLPSSGGVLFGDVIGVGEEVHDIVEDDTIMFMAASGEAITVNGKKYCLLPLDDVLARVEV